jgi:hypothetical protein
MPANTRWTASMSTYTYRRDLTSSDWTKALGIGAAVGAGTALAAAYLARIYLQRTPLRDGAGPVTPEPCEPRRP